MGTPNRRAAVAVAVIITSASAFTARKLPTASARCNVRRLADNFGGGGGGSGGDLSADDWFNQALAGVDTGNSGFDSNDFFNEAGSASGRPASDEWFTLDAAGQPPGSSLDWEAAAQAAAAQAEWAAREAQAAAGGGAFAAAEDDEYAQMMQWSGDTAARAEWGAEAAMTWAGQAVDGRGLRLPTVGIDLVRRPWLLASSCHPRLLASSCRPRLLASSGCP